MNAFDWIMIVAPLAVAGGTFLRLVALGREVAIWRAEVEAEEAAEAERILQKRKAAAMTKLRDVELA